MITVKWTCPTLQCLPHRVLKWRAITTILSVGDDTTCCSCPHSDEALDRWVAVCLQLGGWVEKGMGPWGAPLANPDDQDDPESICF